MRKRRGLGERGQARARTPNRYGPVPKTVRLSLIWDLYLWEVKDRCSHAWATSQQANINRTPGITYTYIMTQKNEVPAGQTVAEKKHVLTRWLFPEPMCRPGPTPAACS